MKEMSQAGIVETTDGICWIMNSIFSTEGTSRPGYSVRRIGVKPALSLSNGASGRKEANDVKMGIVTNMSILKRWLPWRTFLTL